MFEPSLEKRYNFCRVYSSKRCRDMRYNKLPKIIKQREYILNKIIKSTTDEPIKLFGKKTKYLLSILNNGYINIKWGGNNYDDYQLLINPNKNQEISITYV